jgi:hypothetical protein
MDRPLSCARRVLFVATMSTVGLASCEPSRSAERPPLAMRRDLRAACDSGLRYPYFLEFRDSNAYEVNSRRMDSVPLARWLSKVQTYPAEHRRLVVRMNSSRAADTAWILRAATVAGVTVYVFQPSDSVCYPPVL